MEPKQRIHIMTLANSIIGVSILAMPYCFKQCGIVLSILLLIFSSILCRLACHFLLKSAIKSRLRTFEFLAYHVFGSIGKLFVEIGMIGFLLGTCVAFFVVMGDLSPQIIAQMTETKSLETLRTTILIALGLLCVLPLGLLRNVDSLSGVCTATIGFYGVLVLKIFIESAPHLIAGDWYENVDLWRPAGILQCIPIFSMALFCQTQLFEIYQAIPNASLDKMNDLVRIAVNICTSVYIFVGVFGYIAVSHKPNFSGNILMDFQPSIITEIMKIGFVLSVAFSFPLIIFPCRASLYSLLYKRTYSGLHDSSSLYIPEGKFRMLTLIIVTISLIIGVLIPNIELVLGLVGSTIGIMICVIFPATCFICLTDRNTNERVLAQLMLIIGITVMVLGTYANLYAIDNVGTAQIAALDKYTSNGISLNINIQDMESVTTKLVDVSRKIHIKEKEIQIKIPDEIKEVRHEPPQPEETQDNPAENLDLGLNAKQPKIDEVVSEKLIETDKVVKPIDKEEEILEEPKLVKDENSLLAENNILKEQKEQAALEVDIEAIKKEDRELENDNVPVAKANLDEHKKLVEEEHRLVEQNKKILEEIIIRQEQSQKQLDQVNVEKLKAVKNIEQIAQKAIETIVDDTKNDPQDLPKVKKLASDAIKNIINEPKLVPNEPTIKMPFVPSNTSSKSVPAPLSYQLGLNKNQSENEKLNGNAITIDKNATKLEKSPTEPIISPNKAIEPKKSITDLISPPDKKENKDIGEIKKVFDIELLRKKLLNGTLLNTKKKHEHEVDAKQGRDILSHDYDRQKRDADNCDKSDLAKTNENIEEDLKTSRNV